MEEGSRFWAGGPVTAWDWLEKNAFAGRPLLGGDGDIDGEDAEDVDGFWLLFPGGVMWAIPGQKDGFQAEG